LVRAARVQTLLRLGALVNGWLVWRAANPKATAQRNRIELHAGDVFLEIQLVPFTDNSGCLIRMILRTSDTGLRRAVARDLWEHLQHIDGFRRDVSPPDTDASTNLNLAYVRDPHVGVLVSVQR